MGKKRLEIYDLKVLKNKESALLDKSKSKFDHYSARKVKKKAIT